MPDLPSIQDDPLAAPVSATLLSTPVPGTLNVIKRTGTMVPYDEQKIVIAITKAFLEVEGGQAVASPRIRDLSHRRSAEITEVFRKRLPSGGSVHIEEIQDQVELALMRHEHHKAARSYVLYRESHAAARAERAGAVARKIPQVKRADGSVEPLDMAWLDGMAEEACRGVADVSPGQLAERTLRDTYTGMPVEDIPPLLTIAARAMIETEPGYTYVAARLLLNQLRSEALGFLGIAESATADEMRALYPQALACAVEQGVAHERFTAELRAFDLARLGEALDAERDMQFSYQGMQILYDRYFTHVDGVRIELPQVFFMRVAMGLALRESRREERAIEFYHLLSSFDYMCSTPTLFNSASRHSQLSSCYLTTVPDNLNGIFSAIHDNAMLSKWAGGLGNDWTPVRALGSHIKDTNGKSQGVVPFLKVVNDTAVAVNQGGKRRGAVCSYLETWHLDIEEFLELRKNTGDDRRRTHDMNTANWVPDLFMQRVFEGGDWTLFSPSDVPDLHDLYGAAFKDRYEAYEAVAERGEIRHRRMPALDLWRRMLEMLYECGHPWITFKDSLQPALPAAAPRRSAFVQPVHRDHPQYLRRGDRGVQPRLAQPGQRTSASSGDIDHGDRLRAHGAHRHAHARQRHRPQLLRGAKSAPVQHAASPGGFGFDGLSGRFVPPAHAVRLRGGRRLRRPLDGVDQLFRDRGLVGAGRRTRRLQQLRGLAVEPGRLADRFD